MEPVSIESQTTWPPPDQAHPFDVAAVDYDQTFTRHTLGRWLRSAVQAELGAAFSTGQHVLELGCGTGEDAIWLARLGVRVTATDASIGMLNLAQAKIENSTLASKVHFRQWDYSDPAGLEQALELGTPAPKFDGVFSNFGGLNCLADRQSLFRALLPWLKPRARLVLVLMGPVCLWEITWHLLHGQLRKAFRRLQAGQPAHVGAGQTIETWFPAPSRLRAELADDYRWCRLSGLGFFLPPSYLHLLVDRYPVLFGRLDRLEHRLRSRFPWPWLSDHYLAVLEKRA